jgi:hypothetical protein
MTRKVAHRTRRLITVDRSGEGPRLRRREAGASAAGGWQRSTEEEALRLLGAGVWELDLRNGSSRWSEELDHLWQRDPSCEPAGLESFLEGVHPEDRKLVADLLDESIALHSGFSVVHRVQGPGGRERRVHTRGRVIEDDEGVESRLLVAVQPNGAGADVAEPGETAGPGWSGTPVELAEEVRRLEPGVGPLFPADRAEGNGERSGAEPGPAQLCMIHVIEEGALRCVAARPLVRQGPEGGAVSTGGICGVALQRDELRREVADALSTREWVLDILAHDLRAPLNHICLGAAVIQEGHDQQQVTRYAGVIQRSAFRMGRLIQDLLDVSAAKAGTLSLELRPQSLGPVLDEVQCTLELLAPGNFHVEVPELPVAPVDRDRLLQVFFNLVANALKFSPEDAPIHVGTEVREDEILFSVSDQGSGIPADQLEVIFEPYWCSRESAGKGGSGLGLAIARLIVEGHGGRIWADSTPGEGSTFSFTIAR